MEHTKQIFTKMFIKCTFKFKLSTRYCFCFLLLRFSATKHILHGLKPSILSSQETIILTSLNFTTLSFSKLWKNAVLKPFWDNKVDSWFLLQWSSSWSELNIWSATVQKMLELKGIFWWNRLIFGFIQDVLNIKISLTEPSG